MNTPTPKTPLTEYLTQLVEEPQEEYCLRRIDDIVIVPSSAEHAGGDSRRYVGYDENCRKCHGVRGTPPKTMKDKFPKIATFDAKFLEAHSVDSIVKVLTKGKNDDMKSFKDKMSPAELKAVAEYVHELQKAKP